MASTARVQTAKGVIEEQLSLLFQLAEQAKADQDSHAAQERLKRWKSRTVDLIRRHVHPHEAAALEDKRLWAFSRDAIRNLLEEAMIYYGFLTALLEEVELHPENILDRPAPANTPLPSPKVETPISTNAVFVIHGHDEVNLLRLKEIIRDRWQLKPIVLSRQAGKGRTLIEKFEEEAMEACFAFALLTPDDIVAAQQSQYSQARPNVIFELGWFYGRLRRERVAILSKKGTAIHSDLSGISRIDFRDSVEEVVPDIERELIAVGLLKR